MKIEDILLDVEDAERILRELIEDMGDDHPELNLVRLTEFANGLQNWRLASTPVTEESFKQASMQYYEALLAFLEANGIQVISYQKNINFGDAPYTYGRCEYTKNVSYFKENRSNEINKSMFNKIQKQMPECGWIYLTHFNTTINIDEDGKTAYGFETAYMLFEHEPDWTWEQPTQH